MRFDFTLTSTFLFASAVLADLSREHRSSQSLDVVEKRTNATSDSVEVTPSTLAGVVWEMSTPTFQNVTAAIVAPYVWGSIGTGVAILVGLDGSPRAPCAAVFSAGLKCTVTSNGPTYTVGAYWLPGNWIDTNLEVNYTDSITVTISIRNQTSGYAMFASERGTRTVEFNSQSPLCQLSAGWLVGNLPGQNLSHFGFVPFSQPEAYGQDGEEFTGIGTSTYDITTSDGLPLTRVEPLGYIIRVAENYV